MSTMNGRIVLFTTLFVVLGAILVGVVWLRRGQANPLPLQSSSLDLVPITPASKLENLPESTPRTSVADSPSGHVEQQPSVHSESNPNDWKTTRLDELDRMYKSLAQLGPDGTIADPIELNMFFWLTIAPQMDSRGQYQQLLPNVKTRIDPGRDEHVFTFRNRVYRVPLGLYPAFDEFHAFMDRVGNVPNAVPSPDAKMPTFRVDRIYLDRLAAMMRDAQAVIRERTDPY